VRIFSNYALSFTVNDPYFDQFSNGFAADPMQIILVGAAKRAPMRLKRKKGSLLAQTALFAEL
jgi:hypothetical protein